MTSFVYGFKVFLFSSCWSGLQMAKAWLNRQVLLGVAITIFFLNEIIGIISIILILRDCLLGFMIKYDS